MARIFCIMTTLALAAAPVAQAVADQAGAVPPAVDAQFQQDATKSCNDDLDHDRFGSYTTIEDCVTDKTAKLERTYLKNQAVAANAKAHAAN